MIFQFVIVGASLLGLLLGIVVLQASYLTWALRWNNNNTNRLNYFGKSASQRRQFKIWLGLHRTLLKPWMAMSSRIQNFSFETATSTKQGIGFPKGTCTEQSIEAATNYVPTEQDVFVVSQMKSGTTWLQQLVIQILNRGSSYVDAERPLAAVSSWLESEKTVPLDLAPLIGNANNGPSRVIKTHLPVQLCPTNAKAKYIYIARHPVSCFASCVDFMNGNLGPFSVETHQYRDWFLGPNMWFGSWGNHVAHWWKRSQTDANVLFLRFEDLKNDLSLAVDQIATLLEIDALTQAEKNRITAACSFEYMKQNADAFEMYPPHLFQSQADFFVSGNKRRFQDVSSDIAAEILEKCIQQLREQGVDATQIYPSITGNSETKSMTPAPLTTGLSPCETTQQSAVAG